MTDAPKLITCPLRRWGKKGNASCAACDGESCRFWIGGPSQGNCAITEGVAWLGHISDALARLAGGKPEELKMPTPPTTDQKFADGPPDEPTTHIVDSVAPLPDAEADIETPCLISVHAPGTKGYTAEKPATEGEPETQDA